MPLTEQDQAIEAPNGLEPGVRVRGTSTKPLAKEIALRQSGHMLQ